MLRLSNIKLKPGFTEEDLLKTVKKTLGSSAPKDLNLRIAKQSVDARKKDDIRIVLSVDLNCKNEKELLRKKIKNLSPVSDIKYVFPECGNEELHERPLIIGSGPCGLFAAYFLAKLGYRPIVIERGECVSEREKSVQEFFSTGKLNPSSNIQFGEGGAGTFSDGKLNTMVSDREGRIPLIFSTFVENGAPREIMYINKPHIGTDVLKRVVASMRSQIEKDGGEFLFKTTLTDLEIHDSKVTACIIQDENGNEKRLAAEALILAIGHSARDTFRMLCDRNVPMHQKPFAMGVRIVHEQDLIDVSQYGGRSSDLKLPVADYKLTYTTKDGRGVYSFCMCPGGFVVNASSEEKRLCVNGMSYSGRDSGFANSALVVTVTPDDYACYGDSALAGVEFQRELEERMYELCSGMIPSQSYHSFKEQSERIHGIKADVSDNNTFSDDTAVRMLKDREQFVKGQCKPADLYSALPGFICESLIEAMPEFSRRIKGFDSDEAMLFGIESRTSSPVHIDRDEHLMSSICGIYPAGEGAGYAGGITSAAIDGLRVFEEIVKRYRPLK